MRKILFMCLIAFVIIFTQCDNPQQLKLMDTSEYYTSGVKCFNIIKVINDTMGFAVNDKDYLFYDNDEPECVVVANKLLYNNKIVYGGRGEWQVVGIWKGIIKTYPVIKFHEYDSIEFIQHVKGEQYMDSVIKKYNLF